MRPIQTRVAENVMTYGLFDRFMANLILRLNNWHERRLDRMWEQAYHDGLEVDSADPRW